MIHQNTIMSANDGNLVKRNLFYNTLSSDTFQIITYKY